MNEFLKELSELDMKLDISYFGETLDDFIDKFCYGGVYMIDGREDIFGDLSEVQEFFEEQMDEPYADVATDDRVRMLDIIMDSNDNIWYPDNEEYEKVSEVTSIADNYQHEKIFDKFRDLPLREAQIKALDMLLEIQTKEKIRQLKSEGKVVETKKSKVSKI